jgi:hypothetical protein
MPLHRFLLTFGFLILLFLGGLWRDDHITALQYQSGNDLCYLGVLGIHVGHVRIEDALVGGPPLPKPAEFVRGRYHEVGRNYSAFWQACAQGVPEQDRTAYLLKLSHVAVVYLVAWMASVAWAWRRVSGARLRTGI